MCSYRNAFSQGFPHGRVTGGGGGGELSKNDHLSLLRNICAHQMVCEELGKNLCLENLGQLFPPENLN